MTNVGSLPVEGNMLFDFDSQVGMADLLLAIRKSELKSSDKNELRDLVFLYVNGGKDQSVRLMLEQKVSQYKLEPVPKAVPTPPKVRREQPPIGTYREAPSFAVPAAPVVKTNPNPVAPAPVVDVVVEPVKPPVVVAPQEVAQPAAAAVVPPPQTPEEKPVSVAPTSQIPINVQVPASGQEQYLARIREIKTLVNEKVGNPVNLVDINNEVGREYMGALLDAMKRINTGGSVEGAMARLETAYQAVEVAIKAHESGAAAHFVEPSSVSENETKAPPVIPSIKEDQPARVPEPIYTPPAYSEAPQYQPISPIQSSVPPVVPTPQYNQVPIQTVHAPYEPIAAAPQPVQPKVDVATPHPFSSLADLAQPVAMSGGLPVTPIQAAPLAPSDTLLSKEVDDGLNQLLSEWSIFKKSGIFGTGPKGREHPLYKKMAELQIPLLLAGRFEGATQEVRQSLTDYMNGWRYEQGLIYEKGETFEHYLRRVIRHILDLNSQ